MKEYFENGQLLSILIPCYNEGAHIVENMHILEEYIDSFDIPYEIVLVNDGSTDDGMEKLQKEFKNDKKMHLISKPVNQGKGKALKNAFDFSKGDYILLLDADLEYDIHQLPLFFKVMFEEKVGIVAGSKFHPDAKLKYPLMRSILSYGFYILVKILFRLPLRDTQSGFKLGTRKAFSYAFPRVQIDGFSFDIELLKLAQSNGVKMVSAPVNMDYSRETDANWVTVSAVLEMFYDLVVFFYRFHFLKTQNRILKANYKKHTYDLVYFAKSEVELRHFDFCLEHYPTQVSHIHIFTKEDFSDKKKIHFHKVDTDFSLAYQMWISNYQTKADIILFIQDKHFLANDALVQLDRVFSEEKLNAVQLKSVVLNRRNIYQKGICHAYYRVIRSIEHHLNSAFHKNLYLNSSFAIRTKENLLERIDFSKNFLRQKTYYSIDTVYLEPYPNEKEFLMWCANRQDKGLLRKGSICYFDKVIFGLSIVLLLFSLFMIPTLFIVLAIIILLALLLYGLIYKFSYVKTYIQSYIVMVFFK